MTGSVEDNRTSDQQITDLKQAGQIRQTAERAETRGNTVKALLFRNEAWRIENGREWLDKEAR